MTFYRAQEKAGYLLMKTNFQCTVETRPIKFVNFYFGDHHYQFDGPHRSERTTMGQCIFKHPARHCSSAPLSCILARSPYPPHSQQPLANPVTASCGTRRPERRAATRRGSQLLDPSPETPPQVEQKAVRLMTSGGSRAGPKFTRHFSLHRSPPIFIHNQQIMCLTVATVSLLHRTSMNDRGVCLSPSVSYTGLSHYIDIASVPLYSHQRQLATF
jgi:hypothetical protein